MCLAVEEMMIEGAIRAFRKFNIPQEEIVQYIMKEYDGARKKPKS